MSEIINIASIAGGIASILAVAAFVPYIIAILKNKTKPNRATWWIWAFNGSIGLGSYYSVGAEETLWAVFGMFIGLLITAILSLKYGEGGWNRLDMVCLCGTGLSAFLWFIFSSPLIALLAIQIIGWLGAFPTIRKVLYKPGEENRLAWLLFVLSAIANIFAIEQWEFAIAVYPVNVLFIDGSIALLVFWPRKTKNEVKIDEGEDK